MLIYVPNMAFNFQDQTLFETLALTLDLLFAHFFKACRTEEVNGVVFRVSEKKSRCCVCMMMDIISASLLVCHFIIIFNWFWVR